MNQRQPDQRTHEEESDDLESLGPSYRPMSLPQYIEALNHCLDNSLQRELGVRDNYTIFIRGDYEELVQLLAQDERYELDPPDGKERRWFTCQQYEVSFQILPFVTAGFVDVSEFKPDYDITIMIHPDSPQSLRGEAVFIAELARKILERNIPACFFSAKGHSQDSPADNSHCVVYYGE